MRICTSQERNRFTGDLKKKLAGRWHGEHSKTWSNRSNVPGLELSVKVYGLNAHDEPEGGYGRWDGDSAWGDVPREPAKQENKKMAKGDKFHSCRKNLDGTGALYHHDDNQREAAQVWGVNETSFSLIMNGKSQKGRSFTRKFGDYLYYKCNASGVVEEL